ncbi:AlpA family phage regulatory protein [Methylobacterium sp. Leaf88]|uniref:helix-turn-helix transcriptional regulator n=1 Tax=Methylobacterium sp. Leaf88 TaxID=1736244 RepID=UPI0009E78195|nr:AlpA family phage regulatory protein [Methylobacterium sp. Leaf88]
MTAPIEIARLDGTAAEKTSFPATGFVRLKDILAPRGPIPVCRSTWWKHVASGRFPRPVRLLPGVTVWRAEDVRALIERGVA